MSVTIRKMTADDLETTYHKTNCMKRIITSAVFALISFAAVFFNVFRTADNFAEDVLYHRPSGTDNLIKIIKIDDRSMAELGDYSEWDRSVYARLVDTLCKSEDICPAVIGFDILFGEPCGSVADREFAAACERHGNVVCAFSYVFEREIEYDDNGRLTVNNLAVAQKITPFDELEKSTNKGFANALTDNRDGVIRRAFYYFDDKDGREYSLNAEIYRRYAARSGFEPITPPVDENGVFTFRYSGAPSDYENVSLSDVLSGKIPPETFDGCIVLVGAYAAGMMDEYSVPTSKSSKMFGVEIHANIIQALLEEKYIGRLPVWASALICAILCGLLSLVCSMLTVAKSAVICLAAAICKLGSGVVLFAGGMAGSVITFPIFSVIILGYHIAENYYTERRAKKVIENAFSKYVAPQVIEKIYGNGNYTLTLGGECREVAVLFVDIRGFTPLSESLEPPQVVDILNSYLELTTSCIFRYGGTLDKFVGDATMAVFNAPFDTANYILRAVLTAWDIVQGGNAIEEKFIEKYGKHVGFGVGVNCGPAVVGNIGCSFRMDYTAIGDTVNTAARLEANAPRGTVYISREVYENVKDYITVDEVGEIPLKGKSKGVFVYSVTSVDMEKINADEKNIGDTAAK